MKDYRSRELPYYIVGNEVILLLLLHPARTADYIKEIGIAVTLSVVIYVYTFIFGALLTEKAKIRLTYGHKHKMPGFTVFDDIKKNKDIRYDAEKAMKEYEEIYSRLENVEGKEKGKYENEVWYGKYSRKTEDPSVKAAHHDYLLCRDLNICTISLGVIYGLMVLLIYFVLGRKIFTPWFLLILLIEWFITNIAMRSKATRFVHTVIARDLAEVTK